MRYPTLRGVILLPGLFVVVAGSASASDLNLEAAWNECLREARATPQIQECTAAFSGRLTSPPAPDTEHSRLVGAILDIRQRVAAQAQADRAKREAQQKEALERAAAAQTEKQAKEAAEKEAKDNTDRLLAERQQNPRFMQLAWSTVICRWTTIRADAKREIEKEKKYARVGGGVVDLDRLYAAQRRMRRADEQSERARSELREWKAAPLPCKEKVVLLALACLVADEEQVDLDDDSRSACHSLDMVLLIETIYRGDSYLRR